MAKKPIKLQIWLQDDEDELSLDRTVFTNENGTTVEMDREGSVPEIAASTSVFEWDPGLRAFCSSFLCAFSLNEKRIFVGGGDSQVHTFFEVLRRKHAKDKSEDTPTRLMKMFGVKPNSNPKGDSPLKWWLFNWRRSGKSFVVEFLPCWTESSFEVFLNGNRVPRSVYSILLSAINAETTLRTYLEAHPLEIELLVNRSQNLLQAKTHFIKRCLSLGLPQKDLNERLKAVDKTNVQVAFSVSREHLYTIFQSLVRGNLGLLPGVQVAFGIPNVPSGTPHIHATISSEEAPEEAKSDRFRKLVAQLGDLVQEIGKVFGMEKKDAQQVTNEIRKSLEAKIMKQENENNVKGKLKEKSTEIVLRLSREQSHSFARAILNGSVELPRAVELHWSAEKEESWPATFLGARMLPLKSSSVELQNFCETVYKAETIRRPWRRLLSLLSLKVEDSPSASILRASSARSYSAPGLHNRFVSLLVDLKIGLLLWPVASVVLITISCLIAGFFGVPTNISWGAATGLVLAAMGAQGCSYVISPLACHAGLIFVAWAFGFSQAVLLGDAVISQSVTAATILANPFKTVTGGLMGITAPLWDSRFSWITITTLLVSTGLGIGMSGWLMGQPKRAEGVSAQRGPFPDWAGALLGFLAGVGIPVVLGVSKLFELFLQPSAAFSFAFAIVGGAAMGGIVAWRIRTSPKKVPRAICFGILHGVIALILSQSAFALAGHPSGVLLLCATCAYYHATWFTAAFVIGEATSSVKGAVWATLLEGIPFYLAVLISEVLHKPIFK